MRLLKNCISVCIILVSILIANSNLNVLAGEDNLKHVGVSFIFGAASETYLHHKTNLDAYERIILGTTLGTLPGLAKELIDSTKKGNHFSGTDLAADMVGALLGAVVGNFFNNIIKIKTESSKKKKTVLVSISFKF